MRLTIKNQLILLFILSSFFYGFAHRCFGKNIKVTNSIFKVEFNSTKGGITSLKRTNDVYDTEYVKKGHMLCDAMIIYRIQNSDWKSIELAGIQENYVVEAISENKYQVRYSFGNELVLIKNVVLDDDNLIWTMEFRNNSNRTIEIGDIALPLYMNTDYIGGDLMDEDAVKLTYQNRLNRHRLIAKHGSFIYWMRANGVGPYLVMTPIAGTSLEYFNRDYVAFINSSYSGSNETCCSWRQHHTSTILAPKGRDNSIVKYGFMFAWGQNYDKVRDVLYGNGSFDIHVVPGMSLPQNLSAKFSLRTKNKIDSVIPEYPEYTEIEYLGEKSNDIHVYQVSFSKLGDNLITVNYNKDHMLTLEFFVIENLETVIKKRAKFIVQKQQHRNDKWYNGLFSLWDMKEKILRSPEDTGGLYDYMVGGSDDPSNSKCVYLSEKNVVHPDAEEIEALEYFIENFVWGKHQRTDKEYPHPYGIYGSENWYLNRNTEWGTDDPIRIKQLEKQWVLPIGTGLGKERMWRTFDYTTYIMLYYNMYLIAKSYPHLVNYLDANSYLERAFGTSKAFFEVPYSIYMLGKPLWSHQGFSDWAYKLGNFHEKYIVDLIKALIHEELTDKAYWLKNEWEKKVKYFIYDDPSPFGSEFVFDRTAFESTHAIARYAIENPMQPDENLWYDKNRKKWYSHPEVNPEDSYDFLERQIKANIAMRGWLETSYYYLGSARVGGSTLDYMSQMAGWSILDYALYYSNEPAKYARLGYASILSSWALVNSGTSESNYGYRYPGKENDGAVGWNFQTEKYGKTWAHGYTCRGPWYYCGEIDHGLAGGICAAATVVIDDPIFGRIAYGGELRFENEFNYVISRDGVRRRFHFVNSKNRFHLILKSDGFLREYPLAIKDDMSEINFKIENRSRKEHQFQMSFSGLPAGRYHVFLDGSEITTLEINNKDERDFEYPVGDNDEFQISIRQKK